MARGSSGRNAPEKRNRNVIARAIEIANRGDRWFVSLAGGVGKLGLWAGREADDAAESALLAARKARELASGGRTREQRSESELEARSSCDLLCAERAESWNPLASGARERARADPDEDPHDGSAAGHPAGLVPLLRAFGRVVAAHQQARYATLEGDERFWTLLRLIQSLNRSGDQRPANGEDSRP